MCTEKQATKIIKNWIGRTYPENCQEFFTYWSLLNLYYNTIYSTLDNCKDKCKVLKFGEDNESMWPFVESYARLLISLECVGNGEGPSRPNDEVLNSTLFLRDFFNIPQSQVCTLCRKSHRCSKTIVNLTNVKRFNLKFEALMRIVYQIRNNLFHGEKFAVILKDGSYIGSNRDQAERNTKLIGISNNILKQILENI